ncbi:valine--tRNA ligase [Desulfocurvibacter africanus]|uniref:Valine--tRNA ligase n=1 Tax=Desulfocurvibacter africanus subsp. africanus str. Walvis Bay TaxID=690850 RepID=F3Z092_DESAF|nr:valine--tRNA ligase [Desulfocurvibacter africanus]EGJ49794.1 Valyl-tRNA synthetase [Desulfocurvibacter africanus subsp. africanus str. Walvis Bay]
MTAKTLAKGYEPQEVEARWRDKWEAERTFSPDLDAPGEPYSIVIPPPNVTGALHIGHALNITLQDVLCRYQRQKGRKVLWVPGTDHAGIATQNVVERRLLGEGKTRDDLGREQFVEKVWEWKQEYESRIHNQIKRIGASVDWTRARFTMDEGLSRAVREVFVSLYEQGLIYRGEYIINWCSRCHTALADDEVEYVPRTTTLTTIKYPLADGSGSLTVATVRPETLLGDAAVAVHPDDERYQQFIGKNVLLPIAEREIPVIADKYVDMEFGTGCLKITPAHDMNDWEIGRKHELPMLKVIDDAGRMNENSPERFVGMTAEECRTAIVEELKAKGLLEAETDYDHNVTACYRCKTTVEPNVSKQWFVAVKPLAAKARAAVEFGNTKIFPEAWAKTYFDWLDNIRDWCISRQLWWGHRIPVWYCQGCYKQFASRTDMDECPECGSGLMQDEDVLDTWFSSALWPFSTLGWPDKTRELGLFYPTSVLVTGFDILFFWVARMMMMGLHFQEQVPFHHVYLHALVRDEEGKKMSKSTGNVIDPLDMVEKYGCDSLRFTLTSFAAMGRDIKLSEARIEGYRHFVNKLWNAARFTLMNLEEWAPQAPQEREAALKATPSSGSLHNQWILSRLEQVKTEVDAAIQGYAFNDYAQTLYAFVWREFCDWYLEMAKSDLTGDDAARKAETQLVLWTTLSEILVLLHPVTPFVTQEIWQHLPATTGDDIAAMPYPGARPECVRPDIESAMNLLQESIVAVRNIRGELNIAPSKDLSVMVRPASEQHAATLTANAEFMRRLARVTSLEVGAHVAPPKASASQVVQGSELFVPLAGAVDFEAELARLDKEIAKSSKDVEVVSRKLANKDFVAKAPQDVVEKEKEKLAAAKERQDKLGKLQERLRGVMS